MNAPMVRLRHVATFNPSKTELAGLPPDTEVLFLPMEAVSEDGDVDVSRKVALNQVQNGYTYFRAGDVLVAKITPCFENGKGALVPESECPIGFGTTEFHVLRPHVHLDGSFLSYLTRWDWLRKAGAADMKGAAGQQRVPEDFLKDIRFPLPPLPVQRAIAAFLDRKTAAIDALIEKKERLIALLAEKRAALINQAVTKGLDPTVPMKDSGIPWIGEIPAHWEVKRLKTVVAHATSGARGWALYYSEADTDPVFLQSGNLGPDLRLDWSTIQRVRPPVGLEAARIEVVEGDVLVCVTGAKTGNVAYAYDLPFAAYVNQHVALLRPRKGRTDGEFLALALKSESSFRQLECSQYGGTKQGLGLEDLGDVWIASPPLNEQRSICAELSVTTQLLSDGTDSISGQLDRLREYRQALITAAVTGQLDVPMEDVQEEVVG